MLKSPRILSVLFIILYVSFCGCNKAETPSVPKNYGLENFEKVTNFILGNYYDPKNINRQQCFIGASEAALQVLPYSLALMSREFYAKRAELLGAERVVPGRAISISANDPYVIFIPDYAAWKKKAEALEKKEKSAYKKMSKAERRAETLRRRAKEKKVRKFKIEAWRKLSFGKADFQKIVKWIEINKDKYNELPPTHRGPDPFKDDPFGMHHVFFAATNGFLQAIDPHSAIIEPSDWEKIRSKAEDSTFEGIGALLHGGSQHDVVVESPLIGSPALKAGLRAGDIIRKVDGVSIDNMPLSEVVKLIKGPKDTVVKLEVERETELEPIVISIVRGVIEQKAVTARLLTAKDYGPGIMGKRKIGLIRVTSFLFRDTPPSELLARYYEELTEKAGGKLDGFILDLRGNPGGYLQEAIELSDIFLPAHLPVVQVKGARESRIKRTSRGALIHDIPVIVLINSGSASASEIVASALMDHNAALLLGERSFGKATVQSFHYIAPVKLKYTIARYYAPRGYTIQVYGVHPDVAISPESDGSFPPRYREEDMWKHLPELTPRTPDPKRDRWVEKLKKAVGKNEKAEVFIKKHEHDPLKPDFMLIRAMKYFEAMQRYGSRP